MEVVTMILGGTMWLGIALGATAFARTAIGGSTADYIGLLGCFPPPGPSDIEPVSPDHTILRKLSASLRGLAFLRDLGR
jgi:hypothetical protein